VQRTRGHVEQAFVGRAVDLWIALESDDDAVTNDFVLNHKVDSTKERPELSTVLLGPYLKRAKGSDCDSLASLPSLVSGSGSVRATLGTAGGETEPARAETTGVVFDRF